MVPQLLSTTILLLFVLLLLVRNQRDSIQAMMYGIYRIRGIGMCVFECLNIQEFHSAFHRVIPMEEMVGRKKEA